MAVRPAARLAALAVAAMLLLPMTAVPAAAHGTCERAGSRAFVNPNGKLRAKGWHECTRYHTAIGISARIQRKRADGTWKTVHEHYRSYGSDYRRVTLSTGPGGCRPGVYRVKWRTDVLRADYATWAHKVSWTAKARRIYC